MSYGDHMYGYIPEVIRKHPSLAIAREPQDLQLLADLRLDWFGNLQIKPVCARIEMGQCIKRETHLQILQDANSKWKSEARSQRKLTVNVEDLAVLQVLCFAAVTDLRNFVMKLAGSSEVKKMGRRFTIVIPECTFDEGLLEVHPALQNRKLFKSDIVALKLMERPDHCESILSIETFSKRVVYGTDFIWAAPFYYETSKVFGRKQSRLHTKRYPLHINSAYAPKNTALENCLLHLAEDLDELIASGAPSIVHTLQSLEYQLYLLDDTLKACGLESLTREDDLFSEVVTSKLYSFGKNGYVRPNTDCASLLLEWLYLLGLLNHGESAVHKRGHTRENYMKARNKDPMCETFVLLSNIQAAEYVKTLTLKEKISLMICLGFDIERRDYSLFPDDQILASMLDANSYVETVETALSLPEEVPHLKNISVEAITDGLPSSFSRMMLEISEGKLDWSHDSLEFGPEWQAHHGSTIGNDSGYVSEDDAQLKPGEGILIAEFPTSPILVLRRQAQEKYKLFISNGKLVVRKAGRSGQDEITKDAQNLLHELISMKFGRRAALWALSHIVLGNIHVKNQSRGCFSNFISHDQGYVLLTDIPLAVSQVLQFARLSTGEVAWLIGGGIDAKYINIDDSKYWQVRGDVPNEKIKGAKQGVMKTGAVIV